MASRGGQGATTPGQGAGGAGSRLIIILALAVGDGLVMAGAEAPRDGRPTGPVRPRRAVRTAQRIGVSTGLGARARSRPRAKSGALIAVAPIRLEVMHAATKGGAMYVTQEGLSA